LLANVLFGPRRPEWDHLKDIRGPELVPLVVFTIVIFGAGIVPNLLMGTINAGVHTSGIADVIRSLGQVNGGIF
ncbi:MAG TPA: NADH-quinone oxidoreductase subunit M, partial [Desulfobacteria bacterium]|nr:NADH-quinone oxidoreductase subunit M [Desulfobacteria bacterium]